MRKNYKIGLNVGAFTESMFWLILDIDNEE